MDPSKIISWIFDILALTFFISVLFLLFIKRPARNAAIAAGLAAFCAVMGSPDRFQTLTFSPTTGIQMTARQAIQQVQVTIGQLQNLATALAEGSLNELAFSGQVFVGMPTAEKFRIRDMIIDRLSDIGVDPEKILKAQHMWIIVNCSEIEAQIIGMIPATRPNLKNEVDQLRKASDRDGIPSPEVLRSWVSTKDLNDTKINDLLTEYNTVWTKGRMQNPNLIPFGVMPSVAGLAQLPDAGGGSMAAGAYNNGGVLAGPNPSR